jgi:predicted nucleic acid-binding protein
MASNVKVFFDTNLLIDLYSMRKRFGSLVQILKQNKGKVYVSTLSVATLHYYAKKDKVSLVEFQDFTDRFELTDVTAVEISLAYDIAQDNDLEDAVQVASAINAGIDIFYTADKKLASRYKKHIKTVLIS